MLTDCVDILLLRVQALYLGSMSHMYLSFPAGSLMKTYLLDKKIDVSLRFMFALEALSGIALLIQGQVEAKSETINC